jgi:hypothetical protein
MEEKTPSINKHCIIHMQKNETERLFNELKMDQRPKYKS